MYINCCHCSFRDKVAQLRAVPSTHSKPGHFFILLQVLDRLDTATGIKIHDRFKKRIPGRLIHLETAGSYIICSPTPNILHVLQ
jgi:hypothetical protein